MRGEGERLLEIPSLLVTHMFYSYFFINVTATLENKRFPSTSVLILGRKLHHSGMVDTLPTSKQSAKPSHKRLR